MKYKKLLNIKIFLLVATLLFIGCSPYKHISKEGYILSKNKVLIDSKTLDKSDFKNLIKQDPNSSFLLVHWRMYFYSLSNPGEDSTVSFFSRKVFRSLGEKPVEYDKDLNYRSTQEMKNYLKTKGCFNGTVVDSITKKKRKVTVYYSIKTGERYKIDTFYVSSDDESILSSALNIMASSPIKKGIYYDEKLFSAERQRLSSELKSQGYYDFSEEYILFNIDTNSNNYSAKVNLFILSKDKGQREIGESPTKFNKYKIRNIYIYPNYSTQITTSNVITLDTNIIFHRQKEHFGLNKYYVIFPPPERIKIKPILRSIVFQRDSMFSPIYAERTYNSLNQLKNFKFIDISYSPITQDIKGNPLDTSLLDCFIRLSLAKPILISTSLEANFSAVTNSLVTTNSSSNLGMEWNMSFQHKNIFKGAEIFSFNPKIAFEFRSDIFNKNDSINKWSLVNAFETGIDLGLEFPHFLIPFGTKFYSMQFQPHTTIKAGYNYQKRSYFERSIFNFNFGYSWNYTNKYNHAIIPIEINLVKINITDQSFKDSLNTLDKRIQYQFSDHLVANARYSYLYNGQELNKKRDFSYFRFNFESAGNFIYLINNIANAQKNENKEYTIFNIPFAQYLRSDIDFKKYYYINEKNVLVFRTYGGIGIPYGNVTALPYEKSFFGGGANNHRAWQLRELGPGASKIDETQLRYDRSGDMTFGANFEYRFPIAGPFEGAAFVDVGNIWTLYNNVDMEGGQFKVNSFYKELATGAGLGIRLNIQFLIIRFDFAIKLWDPSKDISNRWVLPNTKWSNLNLNFGIGYPF